MPTILLILFGIMIIPLAILAVIAILFIIIESIAIFIDHLLW